MLPTMLYNFLTLAGSLFSITFVVYYMTKLHAKEKALEERITKNDTQYHKIVDDALSKERKILDDATEEADKIITDTKYISSTSKDSLDNALKKLVTDIEKESDSSGKDIMHAYQATLKEITGSSLQNFTSISKELEADLQKQIKAFNEAQLGSMQKELQAYKESQLKQAEDMVNKVVQQVSQEVLNKTISTDDHQKLVIEAFEKAKKQGLFE
jgi:vacuolar-type H+-ATPase subunit E/Vma4